MTVDNTSIARRVEEERKLLYEAFDRLDKGQDVDLNSFRGVLGVVHEPISWDQLRQALNNGSEEAMGTLGRTVLQIKSYYQHRDNVVLKQFVSVTDYLYHTLFGVKLLLGQDGRKVACLPDTFNSELRVVWRNNDYPYYFAEGIEHHNIWSNRPLTAEELEQVSVLCSSIMLMHVDVGRLFVKPGKLITLTSRRSV